MIRKRKLLSNYRQGELHSCCSFNCYQSFQSVIYLILISKLPYLDIFELGAIYFAFVHAAQAHCNWILRNYRAGVRGARLKTCFTCQSTAKKKTKKNKTKAETETQRKMNDSAGTKPARGMGVSPPPPPPLRYRSHCIIYIHICGTYFDADCAELALLAICFLGAQFVDPAGDRERERERVGELL